MFDQTKLDAEKERILEDAIREWTDYCNHEFKDRLNACLQAMKGTNHDGN